MVLKRAGQADITVSAKRFGLSTEPAAGSVANPSFTVKISNAEIAATPEPHVLPLGGAPLGAPEVPGLGADAPRAPRLGDIIGGNIILSCDTRRVRETVALHILTVDAGVEGESMVLAREGEASLPLIGRRLPGALDEVGGSAAQQSFRVKVGMAEILASSWASKAPVRGDTLSVGGTPRAVMDVQPVMVGEVTLMYLLEVVG
jgi:hypothetical protein